MFIDRAKICVKAGKGGDGIVAWRREKYIPKGGPSGGDGGNGGDVIFVASSRGSSLDKVHNQVFYRAKNGQPGGSACKHGKNGQTVRVELPLGTVVRKRGDAERTVLADLTRDGQEFVAARGGRGGRGNKSFANATNRAPQQHTLGQKTDETWYELELKLIADVGLVGMPNAGKSSLIRKLTHARPKVASYPFTTLHPHLGTLELEDFRQVLIADIPGLIEGAHEGVGLGLDFLRHIERTRVIVHVLDASPYADTPPLEAYRKIRHELAEYSQVLADKPELVWANKTDLGDTLADELSKAIEHPVLPVSAMSGAGLKPAVGALLTLLDKREPWEQLDLPLS